MSRSKPDQPGGHQGKFYINHKNHGWFTKNIRRRTRKRAKQALQKGQEPPPLYPLNREYYD